MRQLSIEYAHIYTSRDIDTEHKKSIPLLKQVTAGLDRSDFSLVVMVDDYSFPDPSFNYEEFSEWLSHQGFQPNLLIRESQLIPLCDEVVHLIIKEKMKQQIKNYVTRKKKYPCSLFIAAWYLLRLGKVQSKNFDQSLVAKQLLNILPESFRPFEEQGLKIISATKHAKVISDIAYNYIPGRSIA